MSPGPWSRPSIPPLDPAIRLSISGRYFESDFGTFRPRFTLAGAILTLSPAEQILFLDEAVAQGFNGITVFAGALVWAGLTAPRARERLPLLLEAAAERHLYVSVVAITDSRDSGYDVAGHIAALRPIILANENTLVHLANEPYHPTQTDQVHSPSYLLGLSSGFLSPVALGQSADDESLEMDGADWVAVGLSRARDKWNQVRRVKEVGTVSWASGKPAISVEPIGADEVSQPGRRESDPHYFFCMGVLARLNEIGAVFHSSRGLQGLLALPVQHTCAVAFVEGCLLVPTSARLDFQNAGWPNSPVKGASFADDSRPNSVVRAYTGVSDARAWCCLVGVNGDPALELQNGWTLGEVLADRPGVRVVELVR